MPARDVAIVGVAESDLGVTGLSIFDLQSQAVSRALADAGLELSDVDGFATAGVSRMSAAQMSEYLGLSPRWVSSTMEGGASFELFVQDAVDAIRAGRCEVALISYGSNQRSAASRSLGGLAEDHTPLTQFESVVGPLWPLSTYAMAATRYLHDSDATHAALAEVAIAAREWALLNPAAYRYGSGPLTMEDIDASPMISTPLRATDCCLVLDGGGAIVLTTAERAATLRPGPVIVQGSGAAITHVSATQMPDLTMPAASESGRQALSEARVGISDIDVVQVYDSFTITVLLTLEALGFSDRGGASELIANGAIRPGGSLPLNTSGGGLSYNHPGMFGILLIVEAVRQLRGEATGRQVDNAKTALVHGTGGVFSSHGTLVLGVS
ncbi:MAG: acetyl-CoA acetyltransferase [Acidimicrobiia bacterium]